jgi:hypothetical protein
LRGGIALAQPYAVRRLLAAILLISLCLVCVFAWVVRETPFVRDRVVEALNSRFASQVDLGSLNVGVFPTPFLSGTGLTLRHNGRTDVPPLITIRRFDASAGLYGLFSKPLRLRKVALDHLEIRIPASPRGLAPQAPAAENTTGASRVDAGTMAPTFVIDELESRSATLEIASARRDRLPRVFEIHDLVMNGFGRSEAAAFHAGVTNPVPRGRVETSGAFGPWNAGDARATPIRGEYAFRNADMNAIRGIGGTLSSVGRYRGVLQRIEVEGQTEIPDFSIDIAGQKVPLLTRFKAVVDGTNGDTFLDAVEARLIESAILASGAVVRTADVKGRHVTLDVRIDRGRLEDLMKLAVRTGASPLTGRIDVKTKFVLPAGPQDVIDRLQLDGEFSLAQARFTSIDVQKRINTLSRRGRGNESGDDEGASVVSNLGGRFVLKNAVLSFSTLTFAVPGARVELAGTYDLRGEQMAFAGDLLLDASLPDTMSGFRSLLARAIQPFFRRPGGGSKLPIKISGPRTKPAFGLDVRRAFWFG